MLVLDGYDGQTSGLGLVGGREANANATTKHAPFFRGDRPVKLTLSVRTNRISVKASGREFLAWDGSPDKLTLPRDFQKDATPLFLAGSAGGELEIQSLNLRYLAPAGHGSQPDYTSQRPELESAAEKKAAGTLSSAKSKDQGPLPTGSVWIGTVHSPLNGNANGDCRVTVRKVAGDLRTVQVEQAKDHAIFTLDLKLKDNSVAITNIDSLYAGRGHGGKPTVIQFNGSGQLDGQVLNLQFSFRYNEGLSDSWCTLSAGAQNQLVTETISVRAKGN